jgi:hypothetical protein
VVGHPELNRPSLRRARAGPLTNNQPPLLYVRVRRRVLGQGQGFVGERPGHWEWQELSYRMPLKDRLFED